MAEPQHGMDFVLMEKRVKTGVYLFLCTSENFEKSVVKKFLCINYVYYNSEIVLRTHPFKDNQLIIKFFTKDDGLISCIIKKKSIPNYIIEILTLAEITYKKTKNTSIFYIKECQVEYVYKSIPRCQQKILCAMILCDILNKCLNEVSAFYMILLRNIF